MQAYPVYTVVQIQNIASKVFGTINEPSGFIQDFANSGQNTNNIFNGDMLQQINDNMIMPSYNGASTIDVILGWPGEKQQYA